MRLHEGAVRAAAVVIKNKRYLLCSVTDEELVREIVTAYTDAKPNRNRRPKPPSLPVGTAGQANHEWD